MVRGIDIDLRRFRDMHRAELESRGAFQRNTIVTHEFDTRSAEFAAFVSDELPMVGPSQGLNPRQSMCRRMCV